MLTRGGAALVLLATGLITGGLVLAAPLLIALGTLPFVLLALGLALPGPDVTGAALDVVHRARAGDVVTVRADVTLGGGAGVALLAVHVPPEFEVADGSNVRAVATGPGTRTFTFEFDVRVTRRGTFHLGPVLYETSPALHQRGGLQGSVGEPREIEVHPRVVPVRRLRRLRGTAHRIAPEEDQARLGLQTTDFQEIRQYQWGDPPRAVNWKATARLGPGAQFPLVNEYEVEGRKAVFILLDAGPSLVVGTSVWNGFEAGLGAASGVGLTLLDRGFRLGFYAYNTRGTDPLYPDVGTKQFLKLSRYLARLEPGDGEEGFVDAVETCRPWVARQTPMLVIITRPETDPEGLEEGIKRLRQFQGRRRRPIVLIAPQVHHLVPSDHERGDDAALLLDLRTSRVHARLRRLGVLVVPWNPAEQKLETLLMKGVLPQ